MASAERTYVDPSALCGLYIKDDRSRRFCAWRRRVGGRLPLTRHGYAEIVNAIALAAFRKDISRIAAEAARTSLDQDVAEGHLELVDLLWRRTLDRAVVLSRTWTPALGTRSLDVIHVAAALILEKSAFVTYDRRQASLARAVRLRVLAP